ncbi:MAG: Rho-type gtpase-activating protein, partial [Phylliscum demangeonii]
METSTTPPEPAIEQDDTIYPCKGCGEILEEGKAFELAGHRWHLDCFRCNTCGTLLDADANLLLLGDGSLICNNCTYSCYSCGNKIEDLAIILSGDQAFCANCFRCRNCKRKIENLRYARTSQGIFCMTCHESSMTARRRKKARAAAVPAQHRSGSGTPSAFLDKSLPSLPPSVSMLKTKTSDRESPASDMAADPASESPRHRASPSGHDSSKSLKRDRSPHPSDDGRKENHSFPSSSSSRKRTSTISRAPDDVSERSRRSGSFHIPLLLDTGSAPEFQDLIDSYARDGEPQPPPPERKSSRTKDSHPLDFDHAHRVRTQLPSRRSSDDPHPPSTTPSVRSAEASHGSPADASPHPPSSSRSRPPTGLSTRDSTSTGRARHERGELDRAHSHGSSREVASDERRVQHATARPPSPEGRIQSAHGERFQLQAVPRSKKSSSASHTPVSASPSPSPVGRMTAPGSDPSSAGGTRAAGATDPADAEPVPSPAPRLEHPPSRSSSLRRDHDDESAPPPPWTVHPSEVSHARTDGGRDVPARKPAPGKAVPPSPTMGPAAYATPTRDHLSPAAALASPAMALSPPSGGGAEPPAAESL